MGHNIKTDSINNGAYTDTILSPAIKKQNSLKKFAKNNISRPERPKRYFSYKKIDLEDSDRKIKTIQDCNLKQYQQQKINWNAIKD